MASVSSRSARIPVALLGATGAVGQRFVTLLAQHPWFELAELVASDRSAGKRFRDAARWVLDEPIPASVAERVVAEPSDALTSPLVFSALDADVAGPLESALARAGKLVVSNAKSHRLDPDVPLVVPEVNPEHLVLLERRGAGGIATNPNCGTIGLVLALFPLARAFGVERVHVVTLQALSGAGLDALVEPRMADNVIPFIAGEEEKLEVETRKILDAPELVVSAHCNRVPVVDGHTLCVSVTLGAGADEPAIAAAWERFRGAPQELALPTAPARPVHVHAGAADPQPLSCRDLDRGMAAHVGRLRRCPLLGWKFVTLSHNTLRGAAGGATLLAELIVARGRCGLRPPR